MTIDATVIAVRNRLPGRDASSWVEQVRDLGQRLARNVLEVRFGSAPEGELTAAALIECGMTDEVATALVPQMDPREGFRRLWGHLENVRAAGLALGAPDIVDALPKPDDEPVAHRERLGVLAPLFHDTFLTLDELRTAEPRIDLLFEEGMLGLRAFEAVNEVVGRLEAEGWFLAAVESDSERVLLNSGIGVLVVATDRSTEATLQRTLDAVIALGMPLVDRILEAGARPVAVARGAWSDGELLWALDGTPIPAGASLGSAIEAPPPLLAEHIKSLVGQIHGRSLGLGVPKWALCDSCGSPRAEAARLEVDRGVSTFALQEPAGAFSSVDGASHLALSGRKGQKSSVVACVLRCADCFATRPFPGEEPLQAHSLPARMAGERLPRGLKACLAAMTGQNDPLPEQPVPDGIDEWMRTQKFGATTQFSDVRLTWREAFRLPDALADLGRSMPADNPKAWRDAASRLGRNKERVLAWELRDLGNPALQAQRIVVIAIDPEHAAAMAERWFGPVEDWVQVTYGTCWRGKLLGTAGRTELVLIQDFLGELGPFLGGEADYEFLTGLVRQAAIAIYAGDGRLDWDDDGIQWAYDEGRLAAVVAPAEQLALATRPDEQVGWIDARDPDADAQLFAAVEKRVDPSIKALLKRMRETIAALERELPGPQMADFLRSDELRTLAVHAELSDQPEGWFYLLDGILETLAHEGIGSRGERKVRASVAARLLAEIGLEAEVAESWWHLIEFYERMGVGKQMVQWIQPVLREHPDPILMHRIQEIGRRAPHLLAVFDELRELRVEVNRGRKVSARRAVLEFWRGAATPWLWRDGPSSLPDLLSLAPSSLRGQSTVFIGGPSLRSGVRLATLYTGFSAVGAEEVPEPGASTPAIVLQPKKVDLLRLEQRDTAGHVTVMVDVHDPTQWQGALKAGCAVVPLTPELSVPTPPDTVMARRLPPMDAVDLRDLTSLMHTIRIEPGEHVIEPGLPVGACAWIRSGGVVVDSETLLSTNALLAADALFFGGPYTHEVVAIEPVELDLLSISAFRVLERGRPNAVTALEYAAARSMITFLGAGSLEAGWRARRDRPEPFAGDWALYWPYVQRNGWLGVEPQHVLKAFPEARCEVLSQGVLYEPGAEPEHLWLILDGTMIVDDGKRQVEQGPGSYVGRTGLRNPDVPWAERASALKPVTLLRLAADGQGLWHVPGRPFRMALVRTLTERWNATPRG